MLGTYFINLATSSAWQTFLITKRLQAPQGKPVLSHFSADRQVQSQNIQSPCRDVGWDSLDLPCTPVLLSSSHYVKNPNLLSWIMFVMPSWSGRLVCHFSGHSTFFVPYVSCPVTPKILPVIQWESMWESPGFNFHHQKQETETHTETQRQRVLSLQEQSDEVRPGPSLLYAQRPPVLLCRCWCPTNRASCAQTASATSCSNFVSISFSKSRYRPPL